VLWRGAKNQAVSMIWLEWMAVVLGCVVIVGSFCLGGSHATEPNYADYFYWPLFAAGYGLALGACVRALARKAVLTI
jgi:predicted phage tail protein